MANVDNVNVDKIKTLAKEHGFTMKYLCDGIGKYRSFLSAVRIGTDHIDETELKFIADKLDTTPEYLTDQTEERDKPAQLDTEPALNLSEDEAEVVSLFRLIPKERREEFLNLVEAALKMQGLLK